MFCVCLAICWLDVNSKIMVVRFSTLLCVFILCNFPVVVLKWVVTVPELPSVHVFNFWGCWKRTMFSNGVLYAGCVWPWAIVSTNIFLETFRVVDYCKCELPWHDNWGWMPSVSVHVDPKI